MFYIAYNINTNELLFETPLENVRIEAPNHVKSISFDTLEEANEYINDNSLVYTSQEQDQNLTPNINNQ